MNSIVLMLILVMVIFIVVSLLKWKVSQSQREEESYNYIKSESNYVNEEIEDVKKLEKIPNCDDEFQNVFGYDILKIDHEVLKTYDDDEEFEEMYGMYDYNEIKELKTKITTSFPKFEEAKYFINPDNIIYPLGGTPKSKLKYEEEIDEKDNKIYYISHIKSIFGFSGEVRFDFNKDDLLNYIITFFDEKEDEEDNDQIFKNIVLKHTNEYGLPTFTNACKTKSDKDTIYYIVRWISEDLIAEVEYNKVVGQDMARCSTILSSYTFLNFQDDDDDEMN